MRGFIYVFDKSKYQFNIQESIEKINSTKEIEHEFFTKSKNNIHYLYYTNEAREKLNIECQNENEHVSLIGQYVDDEQEIIQKIAARNIDANKEYVSKLSGAFAIGRVDFIKKELNIFTHIFRIDNVFYRESNERIVIGTDPLIVSILSNTERLEPEIEIKNAVSFFMHGFYADEKTLFKDVTVIPPNSIMTVNDEGITFKQIDDTLENMLSIKPTKEIVNVIKEDYVNALKAVPRDANLNIGVTGGKDSRLALLGLLDAGYKVNPTTRGYNDHPDVLIAKKITEILKLPHKITEPKLSSERSIEISLEDKVLDTMRATSGLVYGYENISFVSKYKGNTGVTGVAALTMKGGYENLNGVKSKNDSEEMIKRLSPTNDMFIEGTTNDFHSFLKEMGKDGFQFGQYKHAVFYKNGRWSSGSRLAKTYSSDVYSPYYDNQFTKSIIKVQKEYLDNSFIQYTLTNRFNPEISKLELAGYRWGFENKGPKTPELYNSWLERAPLHAKTKLGAYNWRDLTLKDNIKIVEKFKEILTSNPNHEVYNIIDYKKVVNLLNGGITSKYSRFLWSLLSVYVYVDYLNEKLIKSDSLSFVIPKTDVKHLSLVPRTTDLTSMLVSINNGLILNNNESYLNVKVDKQINKNLYITTFTKNLSFGTNLKESNIKGFKKLKFNIYIDSQINFRAKYCLILFNENEKISTQWFNTFIDEKNNNLKGLINIPKNVTNYKIALMVPKNKNLDSFIVKYAYSEVM